MKVIKKIASALLIYLTFLVLSSIAWGWLFSIATDTTPEKKITVYFDCEVRDTELAALLEEELPEGIRMVKVHSFSYAFFDVNALESGDIFIVAKSAAGNYRDSFAPLDGLEGEVLSIEGVPCGVRIFDAEKGSGGADQYAAYVNEAGASEDFYLFFGAKSIHYAKNENAVDNAALLVAKRLLELK